MLQDGKGCDMLYYLHRPNQYANMLYTEFFQEFTVLTSKPLAKHQQDCHAVQIDGIAKPRYYLRRTSERPIVRMEMCYMGYGEIFYLRQILLHEKPMLSFESCKVFMNKTYATFQEAAIHKKYIHNYREAIQNYEQCISICTPQELRRLFVTMMSDGYQVIPIYEDKSMCKHMVADFNPNLTDEQKNEELLMRLEEMMQAHGATIEDFGLPKPKGNSNYHHLSKHPTGNYMIIITECIYVHRCKG